MAIVVIDGIQLEPCPFCGAAAVLKRSTWAPKAESAYDDKFWAKCTNPKCAVSPAYMTTPQDAAFSWNARR